MRGIYTYKGIEVMHIQAFCEAVHQTYPTVRALLFRKNRPLKHFRDGATVWIPCAEVHGYPFTRGTKVYHYNDEGQRVFCPECTFGMKCKAAREAEVLQMPESID